MPDVCLPDVSLTAWGTHHYVCMVMLFSRLQEECRNSQRVLQRVKWAVNYECEQNPDGSTAGEHPCSMFGTLVSRAAGPVGPVMLWLLD